MQDIARKAWNAAETALWARIEAHPFERSDQSLDFTRRLARDLGWSLERARGAVAEYRRFCFLAMIGTEAATPSEEVDAVWHLHLTYSRDYWETWCGEVLRGPLHHDPTAGGPVEQARYCAQYARTLARYEAYFGEPDAAYWPGTAARFRRRPRYRMIDGDRHLTLPRPGLWALRTLIASLALAPGSAQAATLNPLDWNGPDFIVLYLLLMVTVLPLAYWRRERKRDTGAVPPAGDLGLVDLAYLAGGPGRVADLLALALLSGGAASIEPWNSQLVVHEGAAPLPPGFEPLRPGPGPVTRDVLAATVKGRLGGVRSALEARSLVPDATQRLRIGLAVLAPVAALLVFGLMKLVVGETRDKPVGFLIVLLFLTVVTGAVILFFPVRRTAAGDAALAQQTARYARAARAPLDSELLFAVAVGGTAALAGTIFAEYLPFFRAPNSGSGDSGGGGGDGNGGDGGGGGCGGCGGGGGD